MVKTFTFKKESRQTGLASIGYPYASVTIKVGKNDVGTIYAPNYMTPDNKWSIGFKIVSSEDKAGWKWIKLKARFDNEADAREWLKSNYAKLREKWNIFIEGENNVSNSASDRS